MAVVAAILVITRNTAQAQLSLTNGTPSVTIDFSSTIAGVENGTFTAAGYQAAPTAGQLNSNAWALTGWSDGALAFGGTRAAATDYGRGTTAVAVTTGGIYANNASGNTVLMMQPGTNDFTPGTMTLKIINNGTSLINQIAVSYKIYQRNDQARSQTVKFSYSTDDVTYTPVVAMDYATPLGSDGLGWVLGATESTGATPLPISLPQTSVCYIRWTSDDNGGSGSRDEIGFDDIIITGNYPGACTPPTIASTLNSFSSIMGNQMTVNYTRGNGTGGMLAVVSPAALSQNPISGIIYTANSNYGTGAALGNGFVVYNSSAGPSGSFTITGLTASTSYNVNLFEYDITVPCYRAAGTLGVQSTGALSSIAVGSQFRSNGTTGNWANALTWEYFSGSWLPADRIPTSADATITIQATHTVDISCPVSLDQTTVSGTLTVSNSGIMNLGTGTAIDVQSGGILRFQTTAIYTSTFLNPSAATLNVATGGKITIGNGTGSTPGYSPLGHQAGLVTWNNGAIFEWNTTDPFITAGVTYFPGAAAGTIPIFRVSKSPSLVPGSASTTVWNGLMEVNANLTLKFAGTKTFRDGIIGTANLNQDDDCGQFIITGTTAQLGGTGAINLNNLSAAGGMVINTASVTSMISDKIINQTNSAVLTLSSGASLYCDAFNMTGSTAFTMLGTATLRLGSSGGISSAGATGNIQVSGARVFSTTGNYIYNGAAPTTGQITGTGLPSTINSLTINNTAGAGNNIVTLTTTNTTTDSLNLANGYFAAGAGQQLNVSGVLKKVVATSGDFVQNSTAGIVNFPTGGTFTGNCNPYDVYTSNGLNFGAGIVTIQNGGSFRINTGGFALTNAPFYGTGSFLVYNTGAVFGAGTEWTTTVASGRGVPYNVTVLASSTSVNFGASGSPRYMLGSLVISSGTFFALSSAGGGDLLIAGNWTRAATGSFTNNARKVTFNGTGTQTITVTGGGTETFGYMQINKTAATILALAVAPNATNITLNGNPASGAATNALEFYNGDLDLNQNTFNFTSWNGNQNNIQVDGTTGNFSRNINSTGGQGVFAIFNNTGTSHTAIIARVSASSTRRALLIFGTNVKVTTGATGGGGGIDFGTNSTFYISTINGILEIETNGFVSTNPPTYGTGSTLIYNTFGAYNRGIEWSATSGVGYPYNVTVQGASTVLTVNWGTGDANRQIAGTLTISANAGLILNNSAVAFNISILGNFVLDGTITLPATLPAYGADILLAGNWTRSSTGVFIPNERAVFFTGSGNSTITANNGETFPYLYLTKTAAAQTVSLNDDISITRILGIGTGTLALQNKNVTMKSDASGTSSINPITAAVGLVTYGTGRFIVERYIPTAATVSAPNHTKSWQLLAVPVNVDNQTVNAAWQEGQSPLVVGTAGLGTIITNNTAGSGGFDIVGGAGASMKTYVSASATWQGIGGTNITHYNQKGYMIFIRGDRSVQTYNNPIVPTTTLRTKGKIMEPNSNVPPTTNVGANLFESVGNPYASAINFANVTRTGNVQDIFYIWDPRLGSALGYGAYQTFTRNGATYDISPGGGSYTGSNRFIESGQAFFVHTVGGAGTVSFTEAAKVAGSNLVVRTNNNNQPEITREIRNKLYQVNNNNHILLDGAVNQFDRSYSNSIDMLDALKISNTGENLGIRSNGKLLAVERSKPIRNRDTIFYNLGQLSLQQYQFELAPQNIARPGLKAFLEDKFLGTKTPVSLTDTTWINFNVVNVPGSYAADRFMLVFTERMKPTSMYSILNAEQMQDGNLVTWETGDVNVTGAFDVERSADGVHFTVVHSEPAGVDSYNWKDMNPMAGNNYYRIHNPDPSDKASYSNKVKLVLDKTISGRSITVFPNPVKDGLMNLRLQNLSAGNYQLKLYNNSGQQVMSRSLNHTGAADIEGVKLPSGISKGIYKLEVTYPGGERETVQVFVD